MEKFWSILEHSPLPTVHAEILAKTYAYPKSDVLKDIPQFDNWNIEDFETIVEDVLSMPPLEGEGWDAERFGEVGIAPNLIYNEGFNMSLLPDVVWTHAKKNKVIKKKKFF